MCGFEDIVCEIEVVGIEWFDVVVVGGFNGVYLKLCLLLFVVVINLIGFDVMYVLVCVWWDVELVVFVIYGDMFEEVCCFVVVYGMDVVFVLYILCQGVESCVLDLCDCGVGVVVGFGLVMDLVMQVGMNVVFLYLCDFVCVVFDIVLEVVQVICCEILCCQWLDNFLQYLCDGVVVLDVQGCVEVINQWLVIVLGIEVKQVIG